MSNLIEKLRKENNEKDKLLTKENNLIMTDMIVYLRSSHLCEYDIEVIRKELFGMVYEAQLREEPIDKVIGEDYKEFCNELMESGRQKTLYEKFLEWIYVAGAGIGILFLIELISSGTVVGLFQSGSFRMEISLGFLLSTVITLTASLVIYWYFSHYSFELSGKRSFRYNFYFVAGFTVFFASTVLVRVFTGDTVLLYVNFLYPLSFFALVYILAKILGDRHANRFVKTHS